MRYIILTLLILYTTINANTVNVFSANNIYYSSLNRIDEGFVLKNTRKISVKGVIFISLKVCFLPLSSFVTLIAIKPSYSAIVPVSST